MFELHKCDMTLWEPLNIIIDQVRVSYKLVIGDVFR